MREQLKEMLHLQDRLNLVVDPNWLTAKFPWHRAIRVEAAELTDHLGWKWWKKQEPNFEQARLEVVDIWHFMLSMFLQDAQGSVDSAVGIFEAGMDVGELEMFDVLGKRFCLKGLTLQESVDILSMFASLGYCFPKLFEQIMTGVGLTWDELHRQYLAKNVLNLFRQAHGYKDGSYVKVWDGREDNEWLADLMRDTPMASADALMQRLEMLYAEHQGS